MHPTCIYTVHLIAQLCSNVTHMFAGAIEYKLRLETSLENEKLDAQQKIKEIKDELHNIKEYRRQEKEHDDERLEALRQDLKLRAVSTYIIIIDDFHCFKYFLIF